MREKPKAFLKSNKDYKEEFLSQMKWSTKHRASGDNDNHSDVSVTLVRKSADSGYTHVNFTFRNGIEKIITNEETEYIQFCAHKNRIFFRPAESTIGYKLYKANSQTTSKNRYTKVPMFECAKAFVGDYELKYDDFLELYYIEKEQKNGD